MDNAVTAFSEKCEWEATAAAFWDTTHGEHSAAFPDCAARIRPTQRPRQI
jgi:hypothetical protein